MPPAASDSAASRVIDGPGLARALFGGERALETQRDALNAINVFPVPDGDTGTNMSLTMRAACDGVRDIRDAHAGAGDVARVAAQGALMGARGNSGVILSQILAGFADAAASHIGLDASAVAACFEGASDAAYRVVSAPREGTILTAIRTAAEEARTVAGDGADALAAGASAAERAADDSPRLLPVLKEAGVVDAGAEGLALMLAGMVAGLRGEEIAGALNLGAIDESWLSATRRSHDAGDRSGICTEFVVSGANLEPDAIRAHLSQMGDSLLVVGAGDIVRVHVHTDAPEEAFAYARTLGDVSHEKTEDMEAQFQAVAANTPLSTALAVVAVGAGEGIHALFRSLGAAAVVSGGQTMNPSAGDIHAAIEASHGEQVIVLPNNKNIVLAAQQAAAAFDGRVRVVETRSIPQGVAALVAMNPEGTADENVEAMTEAIAAVASGEVTLAARATKVGGVEVAEGQPIALIDDELALAGESVEGAVRSCVGRMLEGRDGAIVTLYAGDGVTPADAESLAQSLRDAYSCDVDVAEGGQPHYPYLIGVE
jgi:DAK2 domain fusion protein YloV